VGASIPDAELSSATVNQNGEINLSFQLSPHVQYFLEEQIDASPFQVIQQLDTELTNLQLTGKDVTQTHIYRIGAFNPCDNVISYSGVLPILPTAVTAEAESNEISWTSYQSFGLLGYQLLKNGLAFANPAEDTNSFTDIDIACGQENCYELVVQLSDSRTVNIDMGCVISIGTNQPITTEYLLPSIENNQLVISWQLDTDQGISNLFLYKTSSFNTPGSFTDTIQVSGNQYIDLAINPAIDTICYQLEVQDSCGNQSVSVIACNLVLQGGKQGLDNLLTWHEAVGLGTNYEFVLEKLNEDGSVQTSFPALPPDTFDFTESSDDIQEQINRYRLKAISTVDSDQFIYSNILVIVEQLEVLIPDAFTPNDDGLNDVLEVQGNFINNFQILIYNRWGQQLFMSDDIENAWDGTYEGNPVPTGAYSYLIQGTDTFGNPFVQKGTVLVIRN